MMLDLKLAKELRNNMTEAEKFLWKRLRAKRFFGYKFRRQHIIDQYIVDFICIAAKLVIEADGSQHSELQEYDYLRTKHLNTKGYKVLRFWNNQILNEIDNVLEVIYSSLSLTLSLQNKF